MTVCAVSHIFVSIWAFSHDDVLHLKMVASTKWIKKITGKKHKRRRRPKKKTNSTYALPFGSPIILIISQIYFWQTHFLKWVQTKLLQNLNISKAVQYLWWQLNNFQYLEAKNKSEKAKRQRERKEWMIL